MTHHQIHPTAIVEEGVVIGHDTAIWDGVHVRAPATIGSDCVIGEKTYIAYGVEIGDLVKINAHAYVCAGVTIESGVMVSAGVIFTNDRYPRATTPELDRLLPSEPTEETLPTLIREGATIGAGAVIGSGIEVGRFAMVAMGSVVTRSVPQYHLVMGNPARGAGFVCRCGQPLDRFEAGGQPSPGEKECARCGRHFSVSDEGEVVEVG
jgi:UDP-2-acetamido-3-amino-2,3-dideoxy-glucuronate N-acetyltransferase